jgi:hypothetical protein
MAYKLLSLQKMCLYTDILSTTYRGELSHDLKMRFLFILFIWYSNVEFHVNQLTKCHQILMAAITTRRLLMKQRRMLVPGMIVALMLSLMFMPFNLFTVEAQGAAAGVAGTYAEDLTVDAASAEIFTVMMLHADNTAMIIESTAQQINVFAGAWQQGADALTIDATVTGVDIAREGEPGVGGPGTPPLLDV